MTETSPVVSVNNTLTYNNPASVGRALPAVEVRIDLQVRGAIAMRDYWKRPEDTVQAVDNGGWLAPGDLHSRPHQGITIASTGEKVPPVDLELATIATPLLAQPLLGGGRGPPGHCLRGSGCTVTRAGSQRPGQLGGARHGACRTEAPPTRKQPFPTSSGAVCHASGP